jgi:hypothetical protein
MDEWMKVSPGLKRIASLRNSEQLRKCTACGHRHYAVPGPCGVLINAVNGARCACKREVLE